MCGIGAVIICIRPDLQSHVHIVMSEVVRSSLSPDACRRSFIWTRMWARPFASTSGRAAR